MIKYRKSDERRRRKREKRGKKQTDTVARRAESEEWMEIEMFPRPVWLQVALRVTLILSAIAFVLGLLFLRDNPTPGREFNKEDSNDPGSNPAKSSYLG